MNPTAVKLFFTLFWLVSGVGFLVHELWTGRVLRLPIGHWQMPLAMPFLLLAAINFVRWLAARTPTPDRPPSRRRRPRREPDAEPDPTFRFDDPPGPDE
jgi:hypothetical protein